ncbi:MULTISPECIES: GNAT family N-acetyltransferase [unclassified Streptomyces]|uniref:GNAT family N-acetyltransferase n=1 Tax=unclassified Streptomyces TaxID=2593676 RepID=UPI00037D3574|nr:MULTISPECIES: GNAT family N-acetyltransferase [unclassified Streptomyces]MYT32328.1 GNAT family N-acetyltransferase [Streptomyces sp. SID8354]
MSAAPPVPGLDRTQLVEVAAADLPRLVPLFDPDHPNLAFVHAVVDGAIPGRAWAHFQNDVPVSCLVATTAPFCLAAGAMTPAFFTQAKALLAGHGEVQLVYPPGPGTGAWAKQAGFAAGRRVHFTRTHFAFIAPAPAVPDGYALVRIDGETFSRLDSPMARSIFGTRAQYAEKAVGFALVKDGQVAADGHGVIGGGLIELGANTHPDHRRKGLAFVVLAAVSRWGSGQGLRSVITCHAGKTPSIALARKLGLTEELSYPIAKATC